jgi:hypothetical protein
LFYLGRVQVLLLYGFVAFIFAFLAGSAVGLSTIWPLGLLAGIVAFAIGATLTVGIADGYQEAYEGKRPSRYRVRTWFREREPHLISRLWTIPKGSRDCGNHEFYSDGVVERCRHCEIGIRLRTDSAEDIRNAAASN